MDKNLPGLSVWIRRLKLRHLTVLVAISQHGSLTAAATALGISQPAVSKWLADIEAAIGVQLFIRGRRLRATSYAKVLLHHAERMLGEARRMHEEVEAVHGGASGIVRIGAMMVAAPELLPRVVTRLRLKDSALRIVVIEDIAVGLWPRFERNELDLLVGRLDEYVLSQGFPLESLYMDPYCVIAGPHHALARKRRPTWAEAALYPWVLPPAPTPLRRAVDLTFADAGLPAPRPWLESVSFTTNQVILRESDCLGVISRSAARYYQSLGVLKALHLELTSGIGSVGMMWRDAQPSPNVARVIDALRTVGRELSNL
ncbi:MAG: LysR substrate-binding domain-containing protein [Proteobacteria bacterium]|nr:LysR substrate-binding domain-containing protein [Pseudomonadota bacterium]